jgi:hypothetical protein
LERDVRRPSTPVLLAAVLAAVAVLTGSPALADPPGRGLPALAWSPTGAWSPAAGAAGVPRVAAGSAAGVLWAPAGSAARVLRAPAGEAAAKAEAAELRRRVREVAERAERLAAAADAAQARADLLTATAAVRQGELDEAERVLGDARDRYDQQVRHLYMQGPLAPFEPLLYVADPAGLEMARRAMAETLRGGQRDLLVVEVATGRVELALAELRRSQADLRVEQGRLAARRAELAAELATGQALLDAADAAVRQAVAAEQRRREAAHRALVLAALARTGRASVHGGVRCDLTGTSAAERFIIEHESSGYPSAQNPGSTAFGLGQLLLDQRLRHLGADYATSDCAKQLAAFRAYVRDRYGTAEAAMAFWLAHHWY